MILPFNQLILAFTTSHSKYNTIFESPVTVGPALKLVKNAMLAEPNEPNFVLVTFELSVNRKELLGIFSN